MRYLESDGTTLQRLENFVVPSKTLRHLLAHGPLLTIASQLFGEAAILFKDKINYNLPGTCGFAPHQDIAAGWQRYGQSWHISAAIALDLSTPRSGALEVVRGDFARRRQRLSADGEAIDAKVCATMHWETMRAAPGDVFFFDSFVPHRSGPNRSKAPRRVCYCTFAKAAEGDWRARYFADKRREFPPNEERSEGQHYVYRI